MRIVPDPKYNPDLQGYITSKTRLERGITMAKFLGAYGDKTSLKFLLNGYNGVFLSNGLRKLSYFLMDKI